MRLETPAEVRRTARDIMDHAVLCELWHRLVLTGNAYLADVTVEPIAQDTVGRTVTVRVSGRPVLK